MNKKKITLLLLLLTIVAMLLGITNNVYASEDDYSLAEYTDEYKKWLELPEEERKDTIAPRMFAIAPDEDENSELKLTATTYPSKYTLRDKIPANTVVRNQMQTGSCWAFSVIGALESNLGMQDYKAKKTATSYDFSERHMEYATSRFFLNGEINSQGFYRTVGDGGNPLIAYAYLTNGQGAVLEKDMPFQNNENKIALSGIQNKKVASQVIDTVDFPSTMNNTFTKKASVNNQIKNHLTNYGAVTVSIYGAQIYSPYYNNSTGALYCDNASSCPTNHAVLIIGWDDNYAVSNFNASHRPSKPGAWIIKNSWGTSVGKSGLMYLSYEDVNVYAWLTGIQKSAAKVNYENIYQYNPYGYNMMLTQKNYSKSYLANEFTKKTSGREFLTQVSLFCPETYTCKVYVNPKGTSKAKADLKAVKLKAGASETVGAGYHTLEFAEAVEIKSNNFVVVVEVQGKKSNTVDLYVEGKTYNSNSATYGVVNVAYNKSFVTTPNDFNSGKWATLSNYSCNNTLKAFTVKTIHATKVTLSKTSMTVDKGSKTTLKATLTPKVTSDSIKSWTSSNTKVATVKNGVVTAVTNGTTVITVTTTNGKTAKCTVKVETPLPFKDVERGTWYYDAVKYTYEHGMIQGYSKTQFAPFDKLTRGQLVTILYRKENKPNVSKIKNKFSDVGNNLYYTDAIKWANAKGIVTGYGGTTKFGPADPITRQDLAVILNRYAKYKGKNSKGTGSLTKFTDYKTVSTYAENAVKWAVANGIITGNSLPNGTKTLTPQANATRAEVVVMLTRYIKKFN